MNERRVENNKEGRSETACAGGGEEEQEWWLRKPKKTLLSAVGGAFFSSLACHPRPPVAEPAFSKRLYAYLGQASGTYSYFLRLIGGRAPVAIYRD